MADTGTTPTRNDEYAALFNEFIVERRIDADDEYWSDQDRADWDVIYRDHLRRWAAR